MNLCPDCGTETGYVLCLPCALVRSIKAEARSAAKKRLDAGRRTCQPNPDPTDERF